MSNYIKKQNEVISVDARTLISTRYKAVTKAINRDFWNIDSETQNSLYVGSYGRGTAINTSDIDILMALPEKEYVRYDYAKGNGQSRLLQAVRAAIQTTYPLSDIRADGQVVKIDFSDSMQFEIVPAFSLYNGTYRYPDTNMGGNWRSTNPKAEQSAMRQKNSDSSGLFYDTCKHLRRIKNDNFSSYHLSGIVIDSFVYIAMGNWRWLPEGETSSSVLGDYECVLLNYFMQKKLSGSSFPLVAPGSGQHVETSRSIDCLQKVLMYICQS